MFNNPPPPALMKEESLRTSFAHFMANPSTKLIIAAIPPSTLEGALEQLLRAAFESGFSAGESNFAIGMLVKMLDKQEGKRS